MKRFLERCCEWALRPILLVLAIFSGWHGISGFVASPFAVSGIEVFGPILLCLISYFSFMAAVTSKPPWKNEHLGSLTMLVITIVGTLAWFIGSVLGAGYVVRYFFGKDPDFGALLAFVAIVLVFCVQYLIYITLRKLWHTILDSKEVNHVDDKRSEDLK
jgi:hypothetical protein